ncbi:hypothetical protein JFT91_13090 [Pseudomonas sp. TH08]|uniref:mevalonate kinase family protein n=1 Tax=unclassified Pseudomonas TaxID=196821 RepID=UPI001912BE9C|nr:MULTISPECIES: hypothetical protein [unclassified Pseudomonas]MBK5527799.1 hypothetical protein [Pseudomonas sp. TH06]MBK5533530.1 hypothetical protein [Pseudomonas sp. TH08]
MGEHAALHGCPILACSVGLYCQVWLQPRQDGQLKLQLPDLALEAVYPPSYLADYARDVRQAWELYCNTPNPQTFARLRCDDRDHLVKCAIGEILLHVPAQDWRGFSLRVQSQIPLDAGFGSSGALAVTLMAALSRLFRLNAAHHPLESLAMQVERYQHGQPSGIDHNTSLRGSLVERRRDPYGAYHFTSWSDTNLNLPLADLRIYHTGGARESTGQIIAATRHRLEGSNNPLLASLWRHTERFRALLQQSPPPLDGLKTVVRAYEADLESLGVVPAPIMEAIRAIEKSGGAAKICGAGGLSGDQAGALLVIDAADLPELARYQRINAALAVPGLELSES